MSHFFPSAWPGLDRRPDFCAGVVMSEIERVAQVICLWDGGDWDGVLGSRECSRDRYRAMAHAAREALDAYRADEKRKNCKHDRRTGGGSIGESGSHSYWHCSDCGASYDSRDAVGIAPDTK